MFGAAWRIVKRKQWIKAVKNYVKNPKDWAPNKHTRICSLHFLNNEKSVHPSHPSYAPPIFPGTENIKKNIESLGRFQRVKNCGLLKVANIKKSFVSTETNNLMNITNSINAVIMEQGDNVHVNSIEQNQTNAGVESVILKPLQRSISCQTETIVDETYEDLTYFFGNLNYHDGISTAAVRINITKKGIEDENCKANIPISKDTGDSSCDPINLDLVKSCRGFYRFSPS